MSGFLRNSVSKSALAAAIGAALVGVSATETVKDQLDTLYYGVANIMSKQFAGGADPTGVADAYAAIAAAVASGKGVIYVPAGTFKFVPGQAPINVINRKVQGAGIYRSVIQVSGTNTQTTIFTNGKTSADAWGTGGNLELCDISLRGNWDGATALADQTFDNTAALVKFAAAAGVRFTDVQLYYSYGHNASFYPLGYANFTRVKSTGARKNGLHLEATSGALGVTSCWVSYCDFNSNRGAGNLYIKNGVGVFVTGCVFEDSLAGVVLDGNDNRNVTIENNHAETCTNGLLRFIGAGVNTVYAKNFGDSAVTRTNAAFQKLYAHSNQNGFNGIEEGFGPLLQDLIIGGGTAVPNKLDFYGAANLNDVVGKVSFRTNNNFGAGTPVAEIQAVARGNSNQAYGGLEFGTGLNGLVYRARMDENGHFYPITNNVYSLGAVNQRWSNVHATNITISPGSAVVPANNGEMTFQLTSNTSLAIKVKGSDGVVRTATLALA